MTGLKLLPAISSLMGREVLQLLSKRVCTTLVSQGLSPSVLFISTEKMRGCVPGSALPLRLNRLKYQTKEFTS